MIAAFVHGCALPSLGGGGELDGLQVMSVVVDPPLIRPGDLPSAVAWVADPTEEGFELLLWTCTDLGQGCLESGFPLAQWTNTPLVADGRSEPWLPPLDTAAIPPDLTLTINVFGLACAPGVCPEIGLVREHDSTVGDLLADPFGFARTLPMEGTSLVRREVAATGSPATLENRNPQVDETPTAASYSHVRTGAIVPLHFRLSDETDMTSNGFATCGTIADGIWTGHDLDLTFTAPDAPASCEIWVTIEDGTGGSAVWRGVSVIQ